MFVPHAVKFEQNHMVKILTFLTKDRGFKKHFWQSVVAILKDVSVAETIALC